MATRVSKAPRDYNTLLHRDKDLSTYQERERETEFLHFYYGNKSIQSSQRFLFLIF